MNDKETASQVKKITQTIYNMNFSNCVLEDKDEFSIRNGISEFTTSFKTTDTTKAIVTPWRIHGKGNVLFSRGWRKHLQLS
jgi:hypothetical protein